MLEKMEGHRVSCKDCLYSALGPVYKEHWSYYNEKVII